jgi:methionyl-tRNA synthetase
MRAESDDQALAVVTATAPTPNGPLHLGHLSGPYIAADIAARAARQRGERVLTFGGLDPHQNYVLAKAMLEQRAPDVVLREYQDLVRRALSAASVSYDVFTDPGADAGYRDAVRNLLSGLIARKSVVSEPVTLARCGGCGATMHHAYVSGACPGCGAGSGGGTCEGCGAFTTGMNLVQARCARCGGEPVPFEAEIPVLRLEDYRGALSEIWSAAELPSRVRALIGRYLAGRLPDVPLAYPTDWGIETGEPGTGESGTGESGTGEPSLRVDVWVEMGLGFLAQVARQLDPAARTLDEVVAAWQRTDVRCWHFLGIDNAFYFAILFPGLFAAAGMPAGWLGGLVVNEFYRLDGLKFSTSRNHAVWAHEFLAEQDPGVVRLFLCWDRPDRIESDFTRQAYAQFRDWIGAALADSGGTVPDGLAAAEVRRAERALAFDSFDPGLALRCLLGAGVSRSPRLLAALTGENDQLPKESACGQQRIFTRWELAPGQRT